MLSGVPASVSASGPLSFSQDVLTSSVLVSQFDTAAVTVPQVQANAGLAQANQMLASLLASSDYELVLGDVFGHAGTDGQAFSSAVAAVKTDWSAGRLGIEVQAVPAAAMGSAMAAYAASYAGGDRIFINADWLASEPGAGEIAKTLLEEFGHALDQRLNGGGDSPGDEGELFAFVVAGGTVTPDVRSAVLTDFDHARLQIGGAPVKVEVSGVQSTTDTDGDGVVDGVDLDDDNDGIPDSVESMRAGGTPISSATVGFTYAQTAAVDGYVAGYPSRHDAASVYNTGDRNDPAFLFDGKIETELRVHQGDIFEFRFGGTAVAPRVIKAGSGFTLAEGSGGNDKNIDVYGSFGTTDAAGNANNATGGGMGWKNLQTMIANGTAVLLYSGSSAATQSFTTSIDITHFQIVGRGTHGGWSDLALTSDVDASLDTDGDGVPNRCDLDSDNDGISDLRESVAGNPSAAVIVADADRSGTITSAEAIAYMTANVTAFSGNPDTNGNGIWNFLEAGGSIGTTPVDTDSDGIRDFIDLDSDADGIPDTVEARATSPFTANDGDVRNDDADGDGVIGLFDTVVGFGASFTAPVNTDGTAETDAGVPTGTITGLSFQNGLSWSGGTKDFRNLQSSDGNTTYAKIKELNDRMVVDLGQTLPRNAVVTVRALRRGTVNVVVSQANAGGSTLTNPVTYTSATLANTDTYYDLAYTLTAPTRYINIDNTAATEIRVTSVLWSYPANTLLILPDYIDTDSDDDGVLDRNESGLTRTGVDANGDGIDDGISASYQGPEGVVSAPLTTLQNVDSVTAEVDYRSVETNPLRISSLSVNEGSPYAVFTLSGRTTDTNIKLSLASDADPDTVNATVGTDTGSAIQVYDTKDSKWTNYTHSNTVKLSANKSLLVRVPITNDTTYEGPESFRLKGTFGGTNNDASEGTGGIGTIYDDATGDYWAADNNTATPALPSGISLDDDRPIDINDITVNEGSSYGVFEIAAPVGAVVTLSVDSTGTGAGFATIGTDTGTGSTALQYSVDDGANWTNYTWNGSSGNRPTMPEGTLLEVRVAISQDNVLETAETFKLSASRVSGSTTMKSTGGLGTIRDDGLGDYWIGNSIPPATEAELTAASITLDDDTPIEVFDVTVNEATGWAVFGLEGQAGQSYTPSLSTTGTGAGHAATVSDYTTGIQYYSEAANSGAGGWLTYTSGTIAIEADGHGYLRVPIVNDSPAVFEGPETFRMNVKTTSDVSSFGTGTILDEGNGLTFGTGTDPDETVTKDNDKPTVSISASPSGISEGDASETDVVTYTVTLSGTSPYATTITIDLTGTATLTTDYTLSGLTATGTAGRYTLTIAAGQTSGTFTVDPVGDSVYEGPETVIATIVSAITSTSINTPFTVTTSSATATIYDDGSSKPGGGFYDSDIPPVAVANNYTTAEDTLLSGKNLISDDDNGATAGGVDTDTVGAALTIHSVVVGSTETLLASLPAGTGDRTGWRVLALANGTAYLKADGSFEYAPAANSSSGDSFSYTVTNGEHVSAAAAVTVAVSDRNDPPTAANNTLVAYVAGRTYLTETNFGFNDVEGDQFESVIVTVRPKGLTNGDVNQTDKGALLLLETATTAGNTGTYTGTVSVGSPITAIAGAFTRVTQGLADTAIGESNTIEGVAYDLKQVGRYGTLFVNSTTGEYRYDRFTGVSDGMGGTWGAAFVSRYIGDSGSGFTPVYQELNLPAGSFVEEAFRFNPSDSASKTISFVLTRTGGGYEYGHYVERSVASGESIAVADIMAGKVSFSPCLCGVVRYNADGSPLAVAGSDFAGFRFKVVDDGGTANGGQDTSVNDYLITLDLIDASNSPTAVVPLEQFIAEDATLNFGSSVQVNYPVAGAESNPVEVVIGLATGSRAGTLALATGVADGATVTRNGVTITRSGSHYTFVGTASAVNGELVGLSFTPASNAFSAYDDPADDYPPVPGSGIGGTHTYAVLQITTRDVDGYPAPPASDNAVYPADLKTVDIVVYEVNDAPVASGTATLAAVDEDTVNPPGATVATLFAGNFDDSKDAGLSGTLANTLAGIAITGYTADSAKGVWQYSSNGTTWTTLSNVTGDASAFTLKATDSLRFLPAADYFGSPPSLTCRLIESSTTVTTAATVDVSTNGGTTAFSAATVLLSTTIDPVNDPPVPTFTTDQTATEDGSVVTGQLTSTDVDNVDPPTYSLEGDPIAGLTINADGTFSFDPTNAAYQSLAVGETLEITVTYRVTDDQGDYATESFKITVTGVDDPQTAVSLTNSTIPENSAVGTAVGSLQTADSDATDTFTYSLVSGTGDADNDKFEIVDGVLKAKQSFDFEAPASAGGGGNTYKIRVRSTADAAGRLPATLESELTVTVLNVLEKLGVTLVTDSVRDDLAVNAPDKVTNVGTVAISPTGNETVTATSAATDSRVRYSIDGGQTWTDSFIAKQGVNQLRVRQVDPAGLLAPSEETAFTFTLDTVAAAPTVGLTTDTGSSSSDKVTNVGTLAVGRLEEGTRVEYSNNNGPWSTTFAAVEGLNSVWVRQVDVAGNVSAATAFVFTYDPIAVAPTVALSSDTGASASDGITRVGLIRVTGIETGARVEYSTNSGVTWTPSFTPSPGLNTVNVRQTDVAGNVSPITTLAFTVDTTAATPTVRLASDTGTSPTDKITKVGTLEVGNTETDALVEYSNNGGVTWSQSFTAVQRLNTVRVRQTDKAGNVSPVALFTFTFDGVVAMPAVVLTRDTGIFGDRITNVGTLVVTGVETGARVEYATTTDGSSWSAWATSFTAVDGQNTVKVRQTDVAGNVSPERTLVFTLDTGIPAAPSVALLSDTGASNADLVTRDGRLSLSGVETAVGTKVQYQLNTSTAWTTTFTPVQGLNTVKVRQTDVSGNVSQSGTLTFRFDTTAPRAPTLSLASDTGASLTDRITNQGELNTGNVEANAVVQYSRDGVAWSTTLPTPSQGANSVRVRQTDEAGNVSPVATLAFTLDLTAPSAPTVALSSDTGTSSTDRITRVGTLAPRGESGARFEYSADGSTGWSSVFTPSEGANSVYVRQIDIAGNPSIPTPAPFTFTLDTIAPTTAPSVALLNDTGIVGDLLTRDGRLSIAGLDIGARAEYQLNAATTWLPTFTPVQGLNTVKVRQADLAGNASPFTTFAFTLDSVAARVTAVTLAETAPYAVGSTVTFKVKFSEAVSIGGTGTSNLSLALRFSSGATRSAVYQSGSGTDELLFSYVVVDADKVATITQAIVTLPTGRTLQDGFGNTSTGSSLSLTLPSRIQL